MADPDDDGSSLDVSLDHTLHNADDSNEGLMRKVSIGEMLQLAAREADPPGRWLMQEELQRAKPSMKVLQELLRVNPRRASTGNGQGSLPLHICAANIHSIDSAVLGLVLEAYPEGISTDNSFGLLPIHKAMLAPVLASTAPRIDHIERLITLFPAGLWRGTKERQVPLHLSLKAPRPIEQLVELLLEKYPEAAAIKDSHGHLPLHKLCAKRPCEDVINVVSSLLEAHPPGAVEQDHTGRTPLHWAVSCRDKPNLEILGELLEVAPQAVLVLDNDGFKPISRLMNRGNDRCGACCLLLAQTEESELKKKFEAKRLMDSKAVSNRDVKKLHNKKHFNLDDAGHFGREDAPAPRK